MAQFKAYNPIVEVNGETVLSVIKGSPLKKMAEKLLSENGITNPKPGLWYKQQNWLNAFKQISESVGFKTLFTIGSKIPENAKFPPEIDSIEKALASIDIAYHMNHRGGEIGHYKFQPIDGNSALMICNNPYPCDFDRGIIDAIGRRFKPQKSLFISVRHDDSKPCRKKGQDSCTYLISW